MLVGVCSVAPVVMQDRLEKLFDLVPDDEAEKEAETDKIPIANEEKLVVEKIPIANEEKLVVEKIPIANEEKLAVAEEDFAKGNLGMPRHQALIVSSFQCPPTTSTCLDISQNGVRLDGNLFFLNWVF